MKTIFAIASPAARAGEAITEWSWDHPFLIVIYVVVVGFVGAALLRGDGSDGSARDSGRILLKWVAGGLAFFAVLYFWALSAGMKP